MTPQERLAEAICIAGTGHYRDWSHDEAAAVMDPDHIGASAAILAAAPNLAQDIADGQALRLLREALPDHHYLVIQFAPGPNGYWWEVRVVHDIAAPPDEDAEFGHRFAEAADACRKALEARS